MNTKFGKYSQNIPKYRYQRQDYDRKLGGGGEERQYSNIRVLQL